MPLVTCRSNVFATEKSYLLRAVVTHTLSVLPVHLVEFESPKADSPPVRLRTTTVPANLDVRLPGSQLSVRIRGFVYGKSVGSESIAQSGLLFEFRRFVLKNMDVIGLETTSGPFVEEDCVKFVMTPRGVYDPPVSSPSDVPPVYLHQIDIGIIWGAKARVKDSTSSPAESSQARSGPSQDTRTSMPEKDLFNSHMDIDDVTPWLQIMEKMFATHFIRRYPLIFGQWKLNLTAESAFFPSIARSIAAILLRSNNKALKSQAKKTFNTLQMHRNRVVDGSWAALSLLRASSDASNYRYSLPRNDQDMDDDGSQQLLFEKAICDSMRRLYRLNVRPGKRLKFAGKGPDGAADLEDIWLASGEGGADDVIRALDEEDLPFDSPVPSLPAIQPSGLTSGIALPARRSREIVGDNTSDIHPPTEKSRTTDSFDLEDDLESLIEDSLDTDSLLLSDDDDDIRPATPTTTTCLPISSPQIWTGSDDEMDLDLLSPLCAIDAPPLAIGSIEDRKAPYAQLASPSPSLSSGGRMLMEFEETVVWRA
ncbi:hypothetical protein BS47DRAFT_1337588 [Hydnum rufescens UP504]|uniref:Uncharacterized protein n=1 Tax=Hydnum rufescens UP504 TaxID=1448309 RepID=A0A9P6B787_9AGAM|nr:hypothetical protein BS47DRAFT_1337588 [Hydnum rufescens UP504]